MIANHLWLIGMMGVGKSSVGEASAEILERGWLDTDDLAVALAGRSVAEMFEEGEPIFREWESRAVAEASESPVPLVISCGGGAINDAENRDRMKKTGQVVWLRAKTETLAGRVGDTTNRPLLGADPLASLRRLEQLRKPAYESAAHVIIDTDEMEVEEVVKKVVEVLTSQQ